MQTIHPSKENELLTADGALDAVAIVPAAGFGERLGLGPKAFLRIHGEELITRVVLTLRQCVSRILVALPPSHLDEAPYVVTQHAELYPGERTRHQTILSLLKECHESIVLIQDVSRPFASASLIQRVLAGARKAGAAAAFGKTNMPAATCADGYLVEAFPIREIVQPQPPLAFKREVLERAYEMAQDQGIETQATFELVLRTGIPVLAIEGEELNVKITTPLDWEIARMVADKYFSELVVQLPRG